MNIPPLCIIQARMNSTRLPGKMLLKLGDETLIARAWRIACEAFGHEHCVVAIPESDIPTPLCNELLRIGARIFALAGPESDVLSRFWTCAYTYRWHGDSVIVRYTPDDPFKDVAMMRRVAEGERLPVELGAEAFSLAQLDVAHAVTDCMDRREHLTRAFFGDIAPPSPPPGIWTIDTHADYEAALAKLEGQ